MKQQFLAGLSRVRRSTVVMLLAGPVLAFYLSQFILGGWPWQYGLSLVLANSICYGAIYYLLCALTGRVALSFVLIQLIAGIWAAANHFVSAFRGTPVLPWDFSALGTAAALGVYLLLGFCGIPVFSGGTAGFAQLFSPTGGFLIGFYVSAVLISLLKGKKNNFIRHCLICIFVGIPTVDFFGALFMCLIHNYSPLAALSGAILPFLFGDLLKAVVGALIGTSLNRLLAMRR